MVLVLAEGHSLVVIPEMGKGGLPLIPIVVRLLSIKRGRRKSLLFHKFCPFLQINVTRTNKKLGMGAVMAFVLQKHESEIGYLWNAHFTT